MNAARVTVLACLLFGATPTQSASVDTVRVAIRADLPGTEPGVNRSAIADDVLLHVVEGLVAYDERLEPVPMLAESIDVSADGRVYLFTLRDDVQFHNGESLTADAVLWSWRRMTSSESRWLCRSWYDGTDGPRVLAVEALDSRRVRFELAEPSALFLTRLANVQCLFAVLHPDSADAAGHWLGPVGTGPYRLAEWRQGREVVLERHEAYAPLPGPPNGLAGGKRASITKLRWIVIPDAASIKAALRSGQVDLAYLMDAADYGELASQPGIELHSSPSLEKNVLLFGHGSRFADPKMRRAVAAAIDLEAVALGATGLGNTGRMMGAPNASLVSRASRYHGAVHDARPRVDLEEARRLLREAGYRGETIRLQTNRRYANMFDNAILVQSMLNAAGLNVELEVLEWASQLQNYYESRFELMIFGFSGRTDPALEYLTVVGDRERNRYVQWDTPAVRDLVARAAAAVAREERQSIFDDLHRRMLDDLPLLPLYDHYVLDASGPRLRGYRSWAAAKPRLWLVSLAEPPP